MNGITNTIHAHYTVHYVGYLYLNLHKNMLQKQLHFGEYYKDKVLSLNFVAIQFYKIQVFKKINNSKNNIFSCALNVV